MAICLFCRWGLAFVAAAPNALPNDQNSIFNFCSWAMVTVAAVALIWPLNVPLAALAYKITIGYRSVEMETGSFWWRSTFAALGLCGLTLIMIGVAYLLIDDAGFPAGLIDMVLLLGFIPAGTWFMFWIFALEDMLQGLSVFLVYVALFGLPIMLIGRLVGVWRTLPAWLLPS